MLLPPIATLGDDGDPEWTEDDPMPEAPGRPGLRRWLRPPGLYASVLAGIIEERTDAVRAYEAAPGDFYRAFYYLDSHPAYWQFSSARTDTPVPQNHVIRLSHERGVARCVDVDVARVNPDTDCVEPVGRTHLNTATQIWLETGPSELFPQGCCGIRTHDYPLDTGATTFEEAIIRMAHNVWTAYGNDRRICDSPAYDKGEAPVDPASLL